MSKPMGIPRSTKVDKALAAYCRLRVFDASAISYPVKTSWFSPSCSHSPFRLAIPYLLFFAAIPSSFAISRPSFASTSPHVRPATTPTRHRALLPTRFNQASPALASTALAPELATLGSCFITQAHLQLPASCPPRSFGNHGSTRLDTVSHARSLSLSLSLKSSICATALSTLQAMQLLHYP